MTDDKKIRTNPPAVYAELVGELVGRLWLGAQLGHTYGGARNLYDILGYKKTLTFEDYFTQYSRQDIAAAIINRPANATWQGITNVYDPAQKEADTDPLRKAWNDLEWNLKLKKAFLKVDKLAYLGQYACLLLGFSDVTDLEVWKTEVGKGVELRYVNVLSEVQAQIQTIETEVTSPRYGLPKTYNVTVSNITTTGVQSTSTLVVHHSRIIHVTGETLESEIYGVPYLKDVFNRLTDIEKLSGGSAEMYWRGARPGTSAEVDKEFTAPAGLKDLLDGQMMEYEHGLRRVIVSEGMELKSLAQQVYEPTTHLDVQVTLIAAAKGIPKRILTGSEKAELASTQDRDAWIEFIDNRRMEMAEPQILGMFVDRMMQLNILPNVPGYAIEWTPLQFSNEANKATIGKTRTEALVAYSGAIGVQDIMPVPMFYKVMLGLTDEQIDMIDNYVAQVMAEMEAENARNPIIQPDNV